MAHMFGPLRPFCARTHQSIKQSIDQSINDLKAITTFAKFCVIKHEDCNFMFALELQTQCDFVLEASRCWVEREFFDRECWRATIEAKGTRAIKNLLMCNEQNRERHTIEISSQLIHARLWKPHVPQCSYMCAHATYATYPSKIRHMPHMPNRTQIAHCAHATNPTRLCDTRHTCHMCHTGPTCHIRDMCHMCI